MMTTRRKYQIKWLSSMHREILRRYFLRQRPVDIARDLKITEATVYYTINSELGRTVLYYFDEASSVPKGPVRDLVNRMMKVEIEVREDINLGRWMPGEWTDGEIAEEMYRRLGY